MAKYIIKESELRSAIKKVVAEELSATIEEGIARAIGNALKNTAKTAVKGAIAPSILAQDIIKKTADITNGKDTITGTISNFFGGSNGSSGSKGQSMSRRERKAKAQRDRLSAGKSVSGEYGKPETYPGLGRRTKLANKSEMTMPEASTINWGSFGRHYHDEGDRMWFRKVIDTERSIARVCRGDADRMAKLQRRYKRRLVDWLKDRDRDYEIYIKSIN